MNQEDHINVRHTLDHIQKLPSMPILMVEILETFNNDDVDVTTLANKIALDQALVARVMRVANSSFFGLSGQIGSIPEAISVLGFNNLRGLVTAAAIINIFPQTKSDFDWAAFWRHGIGSAACAKAVAKRAGLSQEKAFTAALLHDIGRLVISVYFPAVLTKMGNYGEGSTIDSLQLERDMLGFDHATLGSEIARRWHFPVDIQQAIELHHTSAKTEKGKSLADVVYIANMFSHAMDDGHVCKNHMALGLLAESWTRLEFDKDALEALAIEAQQIYNGAVKLIG